MVTVEAPRSVPKPLPQIVTQTPWFFCPPVLGPLSRSEKKMLGGIVAACADEPDCACRSGWTSANSNTATRGKNNFINYCLCFENTILSWVKDNHAQRPSIGAPVHLRLWFSGQCHLSISGKVLGFPTTWDHGDAGDSSTPPGIFPLLLQTKALAPIDPWVTQA